MQKKLEYMQRLRLNLIDEENRQFLIKMVQARKAIKQFLLEKDLEKVMNSNFLFIFINSLLPRTD